MYVRKQGYKRKASGKKGSYVRKTKRRYASGSSSGAPKSAYKGLDLYSTQGTKSFVPSTSISRLGTIWPDRLMVPMRYQSTLLFTSTSGVPTGNVFSGNSVYDPNQTGVGHQAYGYDQLFAAYFAYRVPHSSCVARILPNNNTSIATNMYRAGLQASQAVALNLSDVGTWTESGDGISTCGWGAYNSNLAGTLLAMKRSAAKMLGMTPTQANTSPFQEGGNGDPAQQWYWKFYIQTLDQTTTSTFYVDFKITYYTIWSERIGSLASS